jgi:ferredoxin
VRRRDGRRDAVPLSAGIRRSPLTPALDWSAWTCRTIRARRAHAPGSGGDPRAASPRPSRCATTTATAASSTPARCARAIRVTRDEIHLTRGRANTLRLRCRRASARLAPTAVRDALDLCVSCKGCRRECPTGVDMARMKIEFQHQWQRARRALRDR